MRLIFREAHNVIFCPPNGWRNDRDACEYRGVLQSEIKRNQPAQGRAAYARVPGIALRAIGLVNEWLNFFNKESSVKIAFATCFVFWILRRRVFVDAFRASVVNADDNQGLDLSGFD